MALKRRNPGPLRHLRANLSNAQIDCDVLGQQGRVDPQIDIVWDAVRGMIRDHQNTAKTRGADEAVGLMRAHRSAPAMVHHTGGIAANAASRCALFS